MHKFCALTVDSVVLLEHIHSLNQKFKFDYLSCFFQQSCSPIPHISCFFPSSAEYNQNDKNKTNLRKASISKTAVTGHRQLFFDVFCVLYKYFLASVLSIWCFKHHVAVVHQDYDRTIQMFSTVFWKSPYQNLWQMCIFDKSNWIWFWKTNTYRSVPAEREVMVGLRDGLVLI